MKKKILSLLLSITVVLNSVSFTACTCVWIADKYGDSDNDDNSISDPLYEKYSDFNLSNEKLEAALDEAL